MAIGGPWTLQAVVQHYAWGREASESEVAKLVESSGQPVDKDLPYAELWMGTHPSGPSVVKEQGVTLKEAIEKNPEVLGAVSDVPFLFKVLSVRTALSIQSHPDKRLAEKLHASNPSVYKDSNHKPEMAIALSDFEALCGFVSEDEMKRVFDTVPEIRACCGDDVVEGYTASSDKGAALKRVFTALMTMEQNKSSDIVKKMVERLEEEGRTRDLSARERLVLRLHEQYPFDVGVMSSWFFNYVCLKKGEGIVLNANEPHAYLSGEIVECMATSDNVIRAGLTPKFKDTKILCDSLSYKQGNPDIVTASSYQEGKLGLYRSGFDEFEVWNLRLHKEECALPATSGPVIAFCQAGEGTLSWNEGNSLEMKKGTIFFMPANVPVTLQTRSEVSVWAASVQGMGYHHDT
mmetsp:Transcript_10808/g.21472  ORF Transcript_10808/g.21472 Transcript_10808/m.21472 type:complete len:405 (-) Transcript_10808:2270-3484(-)